MKTILSLNHVTFSYDNNPILTDVNFDVYEGEFLGIIGPNGGGKTTLLKLILGFLKPLSGDVSIFGSPPLSCQQPVAYVPQSLRFDKQFPISVLELVLGGRLSCLPWWGRFREEDKKAARSALEKVGLEELQNLPFASLSGGQAQRALIARALVSNPKLLILDEPTASVDAQAEADIFQLLKDLKNEMTLLCVTHDLKTIIDHVDRVLCVQKQVVLLNPQDVCEHFALGLYHTPLIKVTKN